MTSQERKLFEKLSTSKLEDVKVFEKPDYREFWNKIINEYSDQAHFVYELLQNADDAGATECHFDLKDDKLVFKHNGNKHFSVTDIDNVEDDLKKGNVGDLNSITSIGLSAKEVQEVKIGKFGIGFKSVFSYTRTPYVYDENMKFKIERYIIPFELSEDFPERKDNETVFVFPFDIDSEKMNKQKAYSDISQKLPNLIFPNLFLNKLQKITFKDKNDYGEYSKEISQEINLSENTTGRFISIKQPKETSPKFLWTFSRIYENREYTVGFFVESSEQKQTKQNSKKEFHIVPAEHPVFCYFPTKVQSGLKFIIHAPFLLNPNREGIKADDPYNYTMIKELSKLAADSLLYLKEISKDYEKNLIDESILDIIPCQMLSGNNIDTINFNPFYESIRKTLSTEKILPTAAGGFVTARNAYLSEIKDMEDVFTKNELKILLENSDANWVFSDIRADANKKQFIISLLESAKRTRYNYYYNNLYLYDRTEISFENLIDAVSDDFLENQDYEWLNKLYRFILDSKERCNLVKSKKIFLDEDRKAVAAFDEKGHACLFLPSPDTADYATINNELYEQKYTKKLLVDEYKISEPSLEDEIYNKIIPQYEHYKNNTKLSVMEHFKKFFKFYLNCSSLEKDKLINELKRIKFLKFRSLKNGDMIMAGKPEKIYFPDEELKEYFSVKPDTKFLDLEAYKSIVGENEKYLYDFLTELGVSHYPKILSQELNPDDFHYIKEFGGITLPEWQRIIDFSEPYIDGLEENIFSIKIDKNRSVILWNRLITLFNKYGNKFKKILTAKFVIKRKHAHKNTPLDFYHFDSRNIIWLQTLCWLFDSNGELVSPDSVSVDELANEYDTYSEGAKELIDFLNFKKPLNINALGLTQKDKEKFELGELILKLGLGEQIRQFFSQQRYKNNTNSSYKKFVFHAEKQCTVMDIYNAWCESVDNGEWEIKVDDYYKKVFPKQLSRKTLKKDLYISDDYWMEYDLKNPTIPKTWCILFLLGILQSSVYWNHSDVSRRIKIEDLDNLIDDFCSNDPEKSNLQRVYDNFLKDTKFNEDNLSEIENLLRVYKFRKQFMEIHSLFRTHQNSNIKSIDQILTSASDSELSGSGIETYSNEKSLKLGISLIIRELLDCDFYEDKKRAFKLLNRFTFMPNLHLRRIVYQCESPEFKTSSELYDEISRQLRKEKISEHNIEEFLHWHDLPFIILADDLG